MLKKRILITGITGFLGQALCQRLIEEGHQVVGVARSEGKLVALKAAFPDLEIIIGDISDRSVVKEAMRGCQGVFHLAASKHVSLCEEFVAQTVSSNVLGSLNVIKESYEVNPEFVLGISTDKAVAVAGIYGATKLLMEGLFHEAERINEKTKYRIVRYGNVMGSTGSFITKWEPLMKAGKEVVITDPKATRFFWTGEEAINHIFEGLAKSKDSTPYVPQMKGISMGLALEACQEVYGKCPVKVIGLQKGEKLHESVDGIVYSNEVPQYTKEEFKAKFL